MLRKALLESEVKMNKKIVIYGLLLTLVVLVLIFSIPDTRSTEKNISLVLLLFFAVLTLQHQLIETKNYPWFIRFGAIMLLVSLFGIVSGIYHLWMCGFYASTLGSFLLLIAHKIQNKSQADLSSSESVESVLKELIEWFKKENKVELESLQQGKTVVSIRKALQSYKNDSQTDTACASMICGLIKAQTETHEMWGTGNLDTFAWVFDDVSNMIKKLKPKDAST